MTLPAHLDIWNRLHQRRRKRVENNRYTHSMIQYQADLRRQIEVAQWVGERDKIKSHLSKVGAWHPQVMRDRYAELQRALGEPVNRVFL